MFKNLRNKFLLLNMLLISIVMITAFSAIYLTTYNNIQSSNQDKLKNVFGSYSVTISGIEQDGENTHVDINTAPLGVAVVEENQESDNTHITISEESILQTDENTDVKTSFFTVSTNYSLSFNVETDKDGNILNINSIIDMPKESYEEIARQALNKNSDNSIINFEGKMWQCSISSTNVAVHTSNGQTFYNSDNNNKYQMSFLDVTESYKTLHDLLITFLIVGFAMFAVIFCISLYFSNRAIRPIAGTWEKQQQFIADASHELKTPLTIVKSNYDALMEEREEINERQMEWLDYIKVGVDRMARLTNDLLTLANMDNNDLPDQNEDFNISQTIENVVQSMKARMLRKGIALSTEIERDIIVNSDAEKVSQILAILLDNAVKYTNYNERIDVSLAAAKRHIICTVKNSGKGIAKEDFPKLFDRFYRADPSRTGSGAEGCGLGLSIAKAITDNLGGKITAESVENENTTFTFTLGL